MPSESRAPSPATVVAHNGAAVFGGAERWTVRLLAGLQERGHQVLLFCRDEEMRERVEAMGVPARTGHLGGHVALHDAARLAADLRRLAPAGLLLSTFKKTWLGGMAARWAGVPRVVARIGLSTDRPARRRVYGIALRRWVHRIVVNADGLRAGVLADLPELEPRRVITVYNGVEPPVRRSPPGTLRRELGIPADAPVVGAVARLADQKRLDRLLEVTAALPPETHCLVAGEGPGRAGLEARAARPDLAGRVHLLGHREDVGDVLDALDVFLVTSSKEGMSNSMLEAMAVGVPVVSTAVSGAAEALAPEPGGAVPGMVATEGVSALAEAAGVLLGDATLRRRMGEAGRRRVRDRFDQTRKVASWETLLTENVHADVHEGPSLLDGPGSSG